MEIKQNILNPFGSREEMGGGASAWTYGRGVIGSPGASSQSLTFVVGTDFDSGFFYGSPTSASGGMSLNNETQEVIDAIPSGRSWSVSIKINGSVIGTYTTNSSGPPPGNPPSVGLQPSYGSDWNSFSSLLPEVSYEISEITVNLDALTITLVLVYEPPPTPDRTLTNAFVRYSAPGWCFGISGSPLTSPTNQDLIVASGFSIVQGDNGPLDINGEWVVDQTVDSNSGTPSAAFLFSSPELRIAIMNAIGGNSSRASEFGTGTILVYEN
jgi:hypothetical protein